MLSRNTVESFDQRQSEEHLVESTDLGLRIVEVKDIVGSVNRWQDLDSHFRLKLHSKGAQERFDNIKRAMEQGEVFPPVELYKIREKYYIVDGNHRVSAAKQVGQTYIDAHVTEYLPAGDNQEHLLWRERSSFERKTGLSGIEFRELGLYGNLLIQIEQFRQEESTEIEQRVTLQEAAKHWYYEIYTPVVDQIHKEGLLNEFTNRTEADLFLYATYHKMAKSRLTKDKVTYREVLLDFHPTPHKSLREKIIDTVTGLLHPADKDCPYGLIIDEDGLVKVTKNCGGCSKCDENNNKKPNSEPRVITSDDINRFDLL